MIRGTLNIVLDDIERLKTDIKHLFEERNSSQCALICPKCGKQNEKVTNTRLKNGTRERTRKCRECGEIWKTIEIIK